MFGDGIKHSLFREFIGRRVKKDNVRLGKSIIDFQLSGGKATYVEVKSCTLVPRGTLFSATPSRSEAVDI